MIEFYYKEIPEWLDHEEASAPHHCAVETTVGELTEDDILVWDGGNRFNKLASSFHARRVFAVIDFGWIRRMVVEQDTTRIYDGFVAVVPRPKEVKLDGFRRFFVV